MWSTLIPDNLPTLHHEPNSLQLGDVCDGIAGDRDEIGKLVRLDRADAALPTQHFRSVRRNGANNIERRHSGRREIEKHSLVTQLLELLVGYLIAVLDGIGARSNRRLNADLVNSMHGNFQVLSMRLLDHRRELSDRQANNPVRRRTRVTGSSR